MSGDTSVQSKRPSRCAVLYIDAVGADPNHRVNGVPTARERGLSITPTKEAYTTIGL